MSVHVDNLAKEIAKIMVEKKCSAAQALAVCKRRGIFKKIKTTAAFYSPNSSVRNAARRAYAKNMAADDKRQSWVDLEPIEVTTSEKEEK